MIIPQTMKFVNTCSWNFFWIIDMLRNAIHIGFFAGGIICNVNLCRNYTNIIFAYGRIRSFCIDAVTKQKERYGNSITDYRQLGSPDILWFLWYRFTESGAGWRHNRTIPQYIDSQGVTGEVFCPGGRFINGMGPNPKKGTIVGSTLIASPSSTKNREKKRDPEVH